MFAVTPRGAALINRIKADPTLRQVEIRVMAHNSDYTRVVPRAAPPEAPALDQRGTRRAPRFKIGDKSSSGGRRQDRARSSTCPSSARRSCRPAALKPNQRIEMALADDTARVTFNASVAWTVVRDVGVGRAALPRRPQLRGRRPGSGRRLLHPAPGLDVSGLDRRSSRAIYDALKASGIGLMSALPETWLVHLIRMAEDDPEMMLVRLAKEEEGVGISAGAHLAGVKSAMLMQNHGFLASINGIVSCAQLYHIPLLMLISYRGEFGERDPWQTEGGGVTEDVLARCAFRSRSSIAPIRSRTRIAKAQTLALSANKPVALLLCRDLMWEEA